MLNRYQLLVNRLFRNRYGERFELTPGQCEIFKIVYEPFIPRGAIASYTQYGKSDVTSMAVILSAIDRGEKILIVAPSEKQAGIIMGSVIDHFFDHDLLTRRLEYDPSSLETLKRERSKKRITLRTGGEIFILTAEVRTLSKEAQNLMGFGATMVIVDEASLIPDVMMTKILRMVGGIKNGKLIKLGNTFEKNHFERSLLYSKRYRSIIINYEQGVAEGRITQTFIDEAREEMSPMEFGILYECKFPEGGSDDALIPDNWIKTAVEQSGLGGEKKQAGLDVARFGRDSSVYCYREGSNVKRIESIQKMDTMQVVGWTMEFLDEDKPEYVAVDVIGIGAGVYDRLEELLPLADDYSCEPVPVNVGESPSDSDAKEKFYNYRAQIYWNLRNLFKTGPDGKSQISIPDEPDLIRELQQIKYKFSSERKIRIEDKEDMKKRIGRSPDKADALALAFAPDTSELQFAIV